MLHAVKYYIYSAVSLSSWNTWIYSTCMLDRCPYCLFLSASITNIMYVALFPRACYKYNRYRSCRYHHLTILGEWYWNSMFRNFLYSHLKFSEMLLFLSSLCSETNSVWASSHALTFTHAKWTAEVARSILDYWLLQLVLILINKWRPHCDLPETDSVDSYVTVNCLGRCKPWWHSFLNAISPVITWGVNPNKRVNSLCFADVMNTALVVFSWWYDFDF